MLQTILSVAAGVLLAWAVLSWWTNYRLRRAERRAINILNKDVRHKFWREFARDYAIGVLVVALVVRFVLLTTK